MNVQTFFVLKVLNLCDANEKCFCFPFMLGCNLHHGTTKSIVQGLAISNLAKTLQHHISKK